MLLTMPRERHPWLSELCDSRGVAEILDRIRATGATVSTGPTTAESPATAESPTQRKLIRKLRLLQALGALNVLWCLLRPLLVLPWLALALRSLCTAKAALRRVISAVVSIVGVQQAFAVCRDPVFRQAVLGWRMAGIKCGPGLFYDHTNRAIRSIMVPAPAPCRHACIYWCDRGVPISQRPLEARGFCGMATCAP